jgi:thioesterase domain-containing protein
MTPHDLTAKLLNDIPLARAMELTLEQWNGRELVLTAPLSPNRNDKGCAFGGSLASLMTLAGWGATVLRMGELAEGAEVYVQDSQIQYLAPVWQTIRIHAWSLDEDDNAFNAAYRSRGRARARLQAECRLDDGVVAASLSARFVALDPRRPRTPA